MKKQFYWLLLSALMVGTLAFAKATNYPTMTENGKTYYLYTVQKSEGLYAISQRFSVPQAIIIEANPGIEQGLKLGQQIKVPKVEATKQQKSAAVKVGKNQHVVKAKETLYSLSKKYHCTVDELLELNPWATHLTIGSVLQIPQNKVESQSKPSAETSSLGYAEAQPDFMSKANKSQKSKVEGQGKPSAETSSRDYAEAQPDFMSEANKVESQKSQVEGQGRPSAETSYAEEQPEVMSEANKGQKKKNIWAWFHKSKNDSLATTADSANTNETPVLIAKESSIKVGILLPFMLDSINRDASMDRFIDFYQGCLIAIDSLAKNGLTTDVYTFDIGSDPLSLQQALNQVAMANVNLLIGPAYQNQVSEVATFAAKHKIPTVIPFASNVAGINNNPYLFQVVTPQKELYQHLIQKCYTVFQDKHIILVKPYMVAQYNKADFANQLVASLQANNIAYSSISDTQIATDVDSIAALHPYQECVVIMPSTHGVALNKLGEAVSQLKQTNIALFGFPEWNNLGINELYNKKMYQFTSYYASFNDARIIQFYQQMNDKFGLPKNIQQSPNFALFGYDICLFFLQQYQIYGQHFTHYLPNTEVNGLQMNFLFEQVDGGGYWNVGTIVNQIDKDGISTL
ncbi:MAG: LysM peptidoglycan-binding domain-containing protein [Paludibacteraceae bacterium]|nr:LysM peptidoglycan-binding domain-containing protein [Paludibacteraceae bacterium]